MTGGETRGPAEPPGTSGAPRWMTHGGLVALVMALTVWATQFAVGAFASERGLHSDEAAHFMNGLVLRDYLREGLGQSPLEFAREYYRHFPKIAPFMWPPLFHGLLGLFLLPGWPPMPAAIFFVGLCTTWAAWRLYFIVNTFASVPVAVGAVTFFLMTPIVIDLSSSVMIDILIAACAIEAAYWLGRFAGSGSTRDAAIFGLMTALACVAKGNGLSAVVAPVALVLVTGRFELLRRPGLYVAAAVVVVIAAPPLYLAWVLDATLGDFGPPWPLVGDRLAFYSGHVWRQLGPLPLLFAAIGVAAIPLGRPWLSVHARHQAAALGSMVIGAFVFHLLSPHILSHHRYITLALAPILGLAALGVMAATQAIRGPHLRWATQVSVFGVMALAQLAAGTGVRAQAPLGYRDTIAFLQAREGGLAGRRVLVVSNELGEGAGVTEAALLGLQPRPMILRGSKVLAQDDWMGNGFRVLHSSAGAVLDDLEAMHVDYVILDLDPQAQTLAYWSTVRDAMTADAARVTLLRSAPAATGDRRGPLRPLDVYRVERHAPGPPRAIELTGSSTLIGGAR